MAKRQASISKELIGAFQTKLHNLGVGRSLEKSAAKQLEKAKKYAKYKTILKPLMDFGLAMALPIAGTGGAISKIARLSGASFSTDVLYDKIFGDILKMQADPSKIKAKGAVRYALDAERKMQRDLQKSISKKLEDRLMEAGISGASSWAMSELTGSGKSKEVDMFEGVSEADRASNYAAAKESGYAGSQKQWETEINQPGSYSLDEVTKADESSYQDSKRMGFKGTKEEWLAKTYSPGEVSIGETDTVTESLPLKEPQGPPDAPWYYDKTKDFYNIFGWAPKSYYGYGGTLTALLGMGAGIKGPKKESHQDEVERLRGR